MSKFKKEPLMKTKVKKAEKKPDEFGLHEVIHATAMISGLFDDYIFTHTEVYANKELKKSAKKISKALGEFYQQAGAVRFGKNVSP